MLNDDLIVVGIGASAGGLEALQEFFKNVPPDSNLAYVVVQHLSPDYKSMMDELLSRFTKLKIQKAVDGMTVEPNTIYLIPPRKNMYIYKNKLILEDQDLKRTLNLPIDIFFRSLANDKQNKAIGVVLSGTGSDGTLGIKAIKEVGGVVFVQDPTTAKFDGMPLSCINTGLVDFVLPPSQIPQEILNFLNDLDYNKKSITDEALNKNVDVLSKVLLVLRDYAGVDFSYYKPNTLLRRLERRLSINKFKNVEEYVKFLKESDKEKEILYKEMLIGVTSFFRDSKAFEVLKSKVLPEIFSEKVEQLRVWSVGCSTGEEAYSLAILINEYLEENSLNIPFKVFATDIDKSALNFASTGVYPANISADVKPEILAKYFINKENKYIIKESIRKNVIFARHNVLKDPPFSKLNLISCRNLFIYLKPEIQSKVLSSFYFSLVENGFLFLGMSENISEMNDAFEVFDAKYKIYRYVKGYKNRIISNLHLPEHRLERTVETVKTHSTLSRVNIDSALEKIIEKFVPPTIIIDSGTNLIMSFNDVNDYLKIPTGKFTNDVLQLVISDLRPIVRSIVRNVSDSKPSIRYKNIKCNDDGKSFIVDVEAKLLDSKKELIMISFYKNESVQEELIEEVDYPSHYQERIKELEKDLQFTKETLQSTIEELEATNEELQSSNEELIASNEELQSTNEELQSVNEELYTINSEYQAKIEELITLNNDMNNLLNNTNIGTLFLDINLCIRKFTPNISKIFKISANDIGRPIFHFNFNYIAPNLLENISKVFNTLNPYECEFEYENTFYFLRVLPYRNADNAVEGIILTITDITTLKKALYEKEQLTERLNTALELGNIAWWEWDLKTNLVAFHPKKATMLGYTPEEFPKDVYEICNLLHPEDYEYAMNEMREYLKGNRKFYEVKYRIRRKDGSYGWYYDRGGIVKSEITGQPTKLVGFVIDISEIKEIEEKMKMTSELLKTVLENVPLGIVLVNNEGTIFYVNNHAEKVLNADRDTILKQQFNSEFWNIESVDGSPIPSEELPFAIVKNKLVEVSDYKHYITVNGRKILLDISGKPLFDSTGNFFAGFFIVSTLN